jgi:histone deacetylase 11
MTARIVFSPHYDISFWGLERRHPFDSRKYGRAWRVLRRYDGARLKAAHVRTDRAVTRDELLLVHDAEYLDQLRKPACVATALELPLVGRLPAFLIDWRLLRPMRWATRGTVLAAEQALGHGLAINLSGGYHHAKRSNGEGFCLYADVALAVAQLRRDGRLQAEDRVAHIDLDAHQGNGVCHHFLEDSRMMIFDMYHATTYPAYDRVARARIDCNLPLPHGCGDEQYLDTLRSRLPPFLDSIARSGRLKLVFYNAGTDVYGEDLLGCMQLSAAAVLERDLFVLNETRQRGIPTVMVLSGGYSPMSYQLVAATVKEVL